MMNRTGRDLPAPPRQTMIHIAGIASSALLMVEVMVSPACAQQPELPTTAAVNGDPICKTINGLVRYISDIRNWAFQAERQRDEASHGPLLEPTPEGYGCILVPKGTPATYHWGSGVIVVTVAQPGGGIYKGVSRGYLWNNIAPCDQR